MSSILDWNRLRGLSDAPERVFESLCRAIVQKNYGRYGQIRSRRNQPGVEFFLPISRPCDLGDTDRLYGWSCKWFKLPNSHKLSKRRRDQITDSMEKAVKYVDGLTDFVLCLPELPIQADLDWYFGLSPTHEINLHLWADEQLESLMSGGAEVLRRTYFGDLIITPEGLAEAREQSVAPVQRRWVPGLHVDTHVDYCINRALVRHEAMNGLRDQSVIIFGLIETLQDQLNDVDRDLRDRLEAFAEDMTTFVRYLTAIADAVDNNHPIDAIELTSDRQIPRTSERDLQKLARDCLRRPSRLALIVESFYAEIRQALNIADEANKMAGSLMIAVVGNAGFGKTQLAAQLTAPGDDRVAGVFIQGGDLRAGATLDDLASRIPGLDISRFHDLLEMVDAAGARAGYRVPVIIDGLNEAERPAEWRQLLEQLVPILDRFSHALVIVTLRSAIQDQVIPDAAHVLELSWQDQKIDEIVDRYFEHYKIDPGGAWLPFGLFRNPLFVRMYCEAANPEKDATVGAEGLPNSLVGVFELYRKSVDERLTNDPPRPALPEGHVKRRLTRLAKSLWERESRRLPYDDVRDLIDDPGMSWDESLYRRLEEEGVLSRHDHSDSQDSESGILFDRFAGYLISDFILGGLSPDTVKDTLGTSELWGKLVGSDAHPLGEDVLVALVGLLPRRFHKLHLWPIAPEQNRLDALIQTLELESDLLDTDTIDKLAEVITRWPPPQHRRHPLDRLWEVHDAPRHQLNADFLDRLLRSIPLPIRDRTWTEWIRQRSHDILLEHLDQLISKWELLDTRDERDELSAVAAAWMLSSTELDVRDHATKALQRYGRPAPVRLFGVARRIVDVDDPYIEERVLAAAMGAASNYQMPDPGGSYTRALAEWLEVLNNRYLDGGCSPTSNELIRTYVRASFEFAARLHPDAMPEGIAGDDLQFAPAALPELINDDDERAQECNRTLRMDFENYVVGSAIQGRGNYQDNHPEYRRALSQVRGRVWELGWRESLFGEVDQQIGGDQWSHRGRLGRIERYGKKYGWIAYHELVGRLDDLDKLRESWMEGGRHIIGDVDPSFPKEPLPVPIQLPLWAKNQPVDDADWVRSGEVTLPSDLWTPATINDLPGPWVFVEGYLEHRSAGRSVFGFIRTFLVDDSDFDEVFHLIKTKQYLGNNFLPSCPSHYRIFAGEMPWSNQFEVQPDESHLASGHGLIRDNWGDEGLAVERIATEYAFEGARTSTSLDRSYFVPSYGFAQALGLRQLPGTLDLVTLDGARASMTFRTSQPWRGDLLYVHKDLLMRYASERRIVRVAWGERMIATEWHSPPGWLREIYDNGEYLWREIDVLE